MKWFTGINIKIIHPYNLTAAGLEPVIPNEIFSALEKNPILYQLSFQHYFCSLLAFGQDLIHKNDLMISSPDILRW